MRRWCHLYSYDGDRHRCFFSERVSHINSNLSTPEREQVLLGKDRLVIDRLLHGHGDLTLGFVGMVRPSSHVFLRLAFRKEIPNPPTEEGKGKPGKATILQVYFAPTLYCACPSPYVLLHLPLVTAREDPLFSGERTNVVSSDDQDARWGPTIPPSRDKAVSLTAPTKRLRTGEPTSTSPTHTALHLAKELAL